MCKAILNYTKEELQFGAVQALVQEENKASVSLLNRLGFTYREKVYEEGTDYLLYVKTLD